MKCHPKIPNLLAAILSLGLAATAPGQSVLWQLDVVGPATPPNVAVTTAANIDPAASTDGPGYAASAVGLTTFDTSAENTIRHAAGGLLTVSDFSNRHTQFTITAAPGYILNPASLTFDSARGGPAGTRGFEIFAGVEGEPTIDGLVLKVEDEPGTRAEPTLRTVDLSGAEYQGITSITFRYYPLTAAAGSSIDFNAMALNGEVVPLVDPLARTGGPYTVELGGFLMLDASASQPSLGETITSIEWDLTNNGDFSDASGATPAPIGSPDLQSVWGMSLGENPIQLRVTDSAARTTTVATTVTLVPVTAPVRNAGFESPVVGDGGFVGQVDDWTAFNGGSIGILNPTTSDFTNEAPEGNNVGLVTSTLDVEDGLSQVLSGTTGQLQADATYSLVAMVGNAAVTPGFPGYRVQLLAGGTLLAEDDNSLSIAEGAFVTSTVNYVFNSGEHAALVGEPLEVRLLSKGLLNASEVGFDDVRLIVSFANPLAESGGPYTVRIGDSLSLDASASLPSDGAIITNYEWDLNNDGNFGDATGANPALISSDDLEDVWGMILGVNPIQLRVTDSAARTSVVSTTVTLSSVKPTAGFGFLVNAAQADDTSQFWNDVVEGNPSGFGLRLDKTEGNEVTREEVVGSSTQLTHAFQMPGERINNVGGALLVNSNTTVDRSFANVGWNTQPVTMEIWFKPDNLTPTPANGQILFEDGGGTGLGFFIANNQLQMRKLPGTGGVVSYNLATDPNDLLLGPATEEFIQLVGTYNTVGGTMELFVNGTSVGTASPGGNNWTGGDPAAFGTRGGANVGGIGGGQQNTESFNGQIALIRVYNNRILNAVEVGDNFFGIAGPPTPPSISSLIPATGSTQGDLPLQANFDEPVTIGTGAIRIFDQSGPTLVATIDVTDETPVTLIGAGLTIMPSVSLVGGVTYYVEMDAGVVENAAGLGFPGFSGPATWSFTMDDTPPVVLAFDSPTAATPIYGLPVIPYTVSFDKSSMDDATVTAAAFSNAGTALVSVGAVTRISAELAPAVYAFEVTPLSVGTLQIQLVGTVSDLLGNSVVAPVVDDVVYTFADPGSEPPKRTITFDGFFAWAQGGNPSTNTFDASGSDKLVVVATGEHNFPNDLSGNIISITYDGIELTKAVEVNPNPVHGQTAHDIWYLDNPAAVHANGTIVATVVGNGNNYTYTAIGLSGTAPGVGAVTGVSAVASVDLITSSPSSFVIASVGMGGLGNTANPAVDVVSPPEAVRFSNPIAGNFWAGHIVARADGLAVTTHTFEFGTAATDLATIAVEFLAAEAIVGTEPFDIWAAGFAGLTNPNPSLDFDGGGLATGIEWVVGGDPTNPADDAALAPTIDATSDPDGKLLFTFRRTSLAGNDPNTAIAVEYATDLIGWMPAAHEGTGPNDITITEVADGFGSGVDQVTVALPGSLADEFGRLFARLRVVVTQP